IPETIQAYGAITRQTYQVLAAATFQQSDVSLVTQATLVINLDKAAQASLEERDLLAADTARHQFPTADRVLFRQLAGDRASLMTDTVPLLDARYQQMVTNNVPAPASSQLTNLESAIEATPWRSGPPPASIRAGLGAFQQYSTGLGKAISQASAVLQNAAQNR